MKKTFDAIDLAKFIGSILIFAMHCVVFSDYERIRILPEIISRWGVPFFFLCSAYFLFSKSTEGNISRDVLLRYIRRIAILYAAWFVFNIPSIVYYRFLSKDLSFANACLKFLKNFFLGSSFTGSWYLASSIFSAWFVYTLSKKLKTKIVLGITFLIYLLCVLTSAYYGVLPAGVSDALGFLCFPLNIFNGCFYFALGKYIVENKQAILEKVDQKRALTGAIVFFAVYVFEIFLTRRLNIFDSTDVAFSTAAVSLFLFLFLLQSTAEVKNALLLRKLSTIIYCCQGNVLLVNGFLKKIFGVPSILAFLVSSLVAAAICLVVVLLQKRTKWAWTKYLT